MLEIQRFCRENKNWRELLSAAPFNLKIKETVDLVLFKYNQISSDFSKEICCEARGLILEKKTWRVVRIAFNKFFNLGEPAAAKIDWNTATATQKEDGTLISLYYYNGWQIATNSNIYAYDSPLANCGYKNFYDLAIRAFSNYGIDFNSLNKNYTYTFELCSPFNQIVCKYPEIKLFHILTRDNTNLKEIETDLGIPKPRFYNLNSKEEYEELVRLFPENTEGVVIKDKFNNRVKLKTLLYFQLHHTINNGNLNLERVITLIKENDQDEFLSYFPQYNNYFKKVEDCLDKARRRLNTINYFVDTWKKENPEGSRKDFAKAIEDFDFKVLYFKAFDNKLKEFLERIDLKNFIKVFRIKEEF